MRRRRVGPLETCLPRPRPQTTTFAYIDPSTLITAATVFPSVDAIFEQGFGITITRDALNNAIRIASDAAQWALVTSVDVIPITKLGTGTPTADLALYGDGAFKDPKDDIY